MYPTFKSGSHAFKSRVFVYQYSRACHLDSYNFGVMQWFVDLYKIHVSTNYPQTTYVCVHYYELK